MSLSAWNVQQVGFFYLPSKIIVYEKVFEKVASAFNVYVTIFLNKLDSLTN